MPCHFFHLTLKQLQLQMLAGSLATSTNTSASSSFPCAWLCGGEPVYRFLLGMDVGKVKVDDADRTQLVYAKQNWSCTERAPQCFVFLWKLQFDSNDQYIWNCRVFFPCKNDFQITRTRGNQTLLSKHGSIFSPSFWGPCISIIQPLTLPKTDPGTVTPENVDKLCDVWKACGEEMVTNM